MPKQPAKIVPKKVKPAKDEEEESEEEEYEEESSDDEEESEDEPERLKSDSSEDEEEESKPVKGEDYLRQYQYKKINGRPFLGSVAGVQTDPDKGSKAEKMKASLLSQPRVSILIPLPEGSDPKITYPVTLNGYHLEFPYNSYIELPQQVAKVIMDSNKQTIAALSRDRIDGNKEKETALN